MRSRPILVLGGMGPQASSALYGVMIRDAAQVFGATHNEDYPHIIIDSLPVPDLINDQNRHDEAVAMMRNAVSRAKQANPLMIAVSCNTAHMLAQEVGLSNPSAPFVSMIDAVVASVVDAGMVKVGLLATPAAIASGLYANELAKNGVECVVLGRSGQDRIEAVIRSAIAGGPGSVSGAEVADLGEQLIHSGVEGVVLGCTELPIVFDKSRAEYPVFDCLEILSQVLLKRYYEYSPIK